MKFSNLEFKIHNLNKYIGGEWSSEWQLLWIFEELGELSREMQKKAKLPAKLHKDEENEIDKNLKEELGDVLYGLISLAKNLEIDLFDALEYSINKFEKRHNFENNQL